MQFSVQARLRAASGLPRDDIVNTWAFSGAGLATEALAEEAVNRLGSFYAADIGGQTVSGWLAGDLLEPNGLQFSVYEITDPEPRAPIFEQLNTVITYSSAAPLPEEVACCLSFQADPNSGQSQARRRGRVYLGPLIASAAVQVGSDGPVRPSSTLVGTLLDHATALLDASDAEMHWSVWSRTAGAFYRVTNGWVDNAFDTQRRRGADPTARSSFTPT